MGKILSVFVMFLFLPFALVAQVAQDTLQVSKGLEQQDSLLLHVDDVVPDSLQVQGLDVKPDTQKVPEVKPVQPKPLSVEAFKLDETARTARTKPYERYDGNGERYAIIKVVSNDPEDNLNAYEFDFGNIEDLDAKNTDGERWLYVGRNATRITVMRHGYRTVREMELPYTIQPGQTYTLKLKVTVERIKKRAVLFQVQPADCEADIFYRKKNEGYDKEVHLGRVDKYGELSESLEIGEYFYRIISPDFKMVSGPINLNNADTAYIINETLVSKYANVELKAADGAEIYLDGKLLGKGSCKKRLKDGRYEAESRKVGYESSFTPIIINDKKDTTIVLSPMKPIYGTLEIKSSPSRAEIIIDGENYGETPGHLTKLLVGEHTLALYKDEFGLVYKKIKIEKDRILKEKMDLPGTCAYGNISVTSVPEGAEIRIDDHYFGQTPKVIKNIPTGYYNLTLSKDGFEEQSKEVVVKYRTVTEEQFFLDGGSNEYVSSAGGKRGMGAYGEEASKEDVSNALVKSKPENAKLFVDEKYIGLTPCKVELDSGKYDIRLEYKKYRDFKTVASFSGADTTVTYKMKRKLQRPWALYLQGTGCCTQHGSMEVGANLGIYFFYLNFEAYAMHGFDTETVYFNYANSPQTTHTLKSFLYGGRAGIGIICGNRVRLTPQVGAGLLSVYGNDLYTSVITATAGMRIECSIVNHIGLCLVPEYSMVIPSDKINWNKDKFYHQLAELSPTIRNWATGFKCYLGLYFYF